MVGDTIVVSLSGQNLSSVLKIVTDSYNYGLNRMMEFRQESSEIIELLPLSDSSRFVMKLW